MNLYFSINWDDISKFKPSEFSEDPDKYAEPKLIYMLEHLRRIYGKPMIPSPASGALARFSGSIKSQHYVGHKGNIVRKSTAIDIFPKGVPFDFYTHVLQIPTIKGIGIYLDTTGVDGKPWIMFHLDMRDNGIGNVPLVWIALKISGRTQYFYPHRDIINWNVLADRRFFINKG